METTKPAKIQPKFVMEAGDSHLEDDMKQLKKLMNNMEDQALEKRPRTVVNQPSNELQFSEPVYPQVFGKWQFHGK